MKKILIAGDLYLGSEAIENQITKGEGKKIFGELLPIIKESSFSIGNLESPILDGEGEQIIKSGPHLKSSMYTLRTLQETGFDLLTLANNHIMDFGHKGLKSTLEKCQELNISTVGAGLSMPEARKSHLIKLNDIRVRVLNFAENEFSTIGLRSSGANPLNPINNYYDLIQAKDESDFVIVIVHGGREHYNLPSPKFQETLRFYAACGADLVLAHHTHCFSGYEYYNDTPIFYSVGNFLFPASYRKDRPLWNYGYAVQFAPSLKKPLEFEIIPYVQEKNDSSFMRLLDAKENVEFQYKLEQLNQVIEDDDLLKAEWTKYIEEQKLYYRKNLHIKNKWIRKLVNRNIIPSKLFFNKKHETLIYNLVNCETHREILLDSIKPN